MGEASSGSCVQLGRPERSVDPRTFNASSNNGTTCSGQIHHEKKPLLVERGTIILCSGSGSVSTHPVRVMMLLRWSVLALRTPTSSSEPAPPRTILTPRPQHRILTLNTGNSVRTVCCLSSKSLSFYSKTITPGAQ